MIILLPRFWVSTGVIYAYSDRQTVDTTEKRRERGWEEFVISHSNALLAFGFLMAIIAIQFGIIKIQAAQIRHLKERK